MRASENEKANEWLSHILHDFDSARTVRNYFAAYIELILNWDELSRISHSAHLELKLG